LVIQKIGLKESYLNRACCQHVCKFIKGDVYGKKIDDIELNLKVEPFEIMMDLDVI